MNPPPDSALADPQHLVADLQRELANAQRELVERAAERDEALAQQAATAEVLKVINSSPGNLTPVFEAMLEKAMRLCEARLGILLTYDGSVYQTASLRGAPAPYVEFMMRGPIRPGPATGLARLSHERCVIHIADLADDQAYRERDPLRVASVELGGMRTFLAVPLVKDDALLGALVVYRQEVRPFTDKQIALLQNFAAQAVIAMENARLITETREALEQQTATAEVLQVINSSPGDLAPVFDAMLEKATRLCDGINGILWTFEGKRARLAASRNMLPAAVELLRRQGEAGNHPMVQRVIAGDHLFQFDLAENEAYRSGEIAAAAAVIASGVRTIIWVGLLKEGTAVGAFVISRQEVRPFSDKQIALLQDFAAQAVIAMENARLLTETREALEQQTATAEVLQVINSSPGDLAPVFDAMLEKALDLCSAAFGVLWTYDGEFTHAAAIRGATTAYREFLSAPHRPGPGSAQLRLIQGERFVHVADLADSDDYRSGDALPRALVDLGGGRSLLALPLRKDGAYVGAIMIYRQQPNPFSGREIALLENFAAQAVIAMENARLLEDLRERTNDLQQSLEYQTATSDVLKVISRSTFDLKPIFKTIVATAARLCDADTANIGNCEGDGVRIAATFAASSEFNEFIQDRLLKVGYGSVFGRTVISGQVVHVPDIASDPEYNIPEAITLGKYRTTLGVPLLRDGAVIGVITLARSRVEPFTDRQIELVRTFGDQAVIAIENARLITETREALDQQTATAEVLQVINSSPGDLAPVFDAMLEKAMRLCEAAFGQLDTYDGARFQTVVTAGVPAAFAEHRSHHAPAYGPGSGPLRMLAGETLLNHVDLKDEDIYRVGDPNRRALVDLGGARSALQVALRKGDVLLGFMTLFRQEVRPFTDKQIALLQNFAAQAVIAIENARLIAETREALEQQTATAEVLQVINASPGDLAPVFDAILEKAHALCGATFGSLQTYDGEFFRSVASRGLPDTFLELLREPFRPHPNSFEERLVRGDDLVHIPDVTPLGPLPDDPLSHTAVEAAGLRTLLLLPLRKEAALVGYVASARSEVRPFSDKQIALLQNFAAQAVIAMENARLITETQEALERQTATAEVLGVINSSPGDLAPVFEAILEKAHSLCGAAFGALLAYDGKHLRAVAMHGLPEPFAEIVGEPFTMSPRAPIMRLIRGELDLVHIPDMAEVLAHLPDDPVLRAAVELGGNRTLLAVPLRKDDRVLGVITAYRQEVRPFSDKQVALLQNFAAQAVIAMDNARLLDEIRQRQQELRVTFDNMVDGVAMFDEALRLAAWNRNFQELLQLSDEFLAQPHGFDDYIRYLTERGEFGETDPETQIKRLRARIGEHYSFERTRPDGTVIEVRHSPMPGGGLVLIFSDITERKRSEEEIRAARDAAEAAYADLKAAQANLIQAEKMASLGQLTAGIAHEIKNPLNFVNNFASLSNELLEELKEEAEPALATLDGGKRAEIDETLVMLSGNLEKIAEHGKRADNIVKSMLEHSRGVSGERRAVDLNILIDDALNLAYHGARAQDASFNVTLERDLAPALAQIELAPQEITRVFLNLFGNGFYATTKRERETGNGSFRPILAVTTRDLGDEVEIKVRDNGTGIPPEIRDKLFQPFFTTKPTGEGTGLGLSISYDIVTQQHGGTITVESEPGAYTEFTVRLPRH